MSRIEEIIKRLCPNGVEHLELGSMVKVLRGKRLTKSELSSNNKYPVFHGGLDPLGYYSHTNRPANSVMVINVGASAGTIGFSNVDFWSSDGCYCIEHTDKLVSRYIYYALLCQEDSIKNRVRVAGIPTLDAVIIQKIQIPIPPLEVQNEIINILDKFTLLEAELEAELEARKTQYEHYRDTLLSFESKNVEWKMLGENASILRGSAFTKKETIAGQFPVVANGPLPISFHNQCNRQGESIVVARSGAYAGLVSYWNEPIFLTDAFSIHPDRSILSSKFLYYFLINLQDKIHKMKRGSGVPHVRASEFETYQIPVPPLKEQERIVVILDKFDALVSDISSGLPAEIEARRKQYECYRNKLLTFKHRSNG
jgi:type I restriction enzyme S subunit